MRLSFCPGYLALLCLRRETIFAHQTCLRCRVLSPWKGSPGVPDFERRSESDLAKLTFMEENIKIVKFLYNTIPGKITVVHDHEADLYPRL